MPLFEKVNSMKSPIPKQEAMTRVQDALSGSRNWRFISMQASEDALSFSVMSRRFGRFSAFCPDVRIQCCESDAGVSVRTLCRTKEQIRVMLPMAAGIFLLLEVFNLIMVMRGTSPGIAALALPILLLVLLGVLTVLGLRLPAKEIRQTVEKALYRSSEAQRISN